MGKSGKINENQDIDKSLIDENLSKSPEERLQAHEKARKLVQILYLAGKKLRGRSK